MQKYAPKKSQKSRGSNTSWGKVATWYKGAVESSHSYQQDLILPNLLRLVEPKSGELILDLACGEGFFTRALAKSGAQVIGSDISTELIALAKKQSPQIKFQTTASDKLEFLKSSSVDKITLVLALQNIERVLETFKECARVLKPTGSLHLVLNHPAFRIPKASSWEYDEKTKIQYRRLDKYLSEAREEIAMHPSQKNSPKTISFHRPLQFYAKALKKAGLAISTLEEWSSPRASQAGPRQASEDRARKEFPLFLYIEAKKF